MDPEADVSPEAIRAALGGQPFFARRARSGDELDRLSRRVLELESALQRERARRREAERGLSAVSDQASALRTENDELRAVIRDTR